MPERSEIVLPTLEIAPGVVAGAAPAGWLPLTQTNLLILVGVTGVGKSTTLARMDEQETCPHPLPERRALTDRLIIPAVQNAIGEAISPVFDRSARFGYTRRFRDFFSGGMAQALTLISVAPDLVDRPLLFDGLRGEQEVAYALRMLPRACFVMLDAPDLVRVLRLLGRNDAFDRILPPAGGAPAVTLGDLLQDEVGALFSEEEVAQLRALVADGSLSADEVLAKVRIVSEERRNYDPAAARRLLASVTGDRALIIDTTAHDSTAVAATILSACRQWFANTSEVGRADA